MLDSIKEHKNITQYFTRIAIKIYIHTGIKTNKIKSRKKKIKTKKLIVTDSKKAAKLTTKINLISHNKETK